jgi:hypothetical protein
MRYKDTEQAIEAELSRHTNIQYCIERGGKHPRVVISCGGRRRKVPFSGTPSDHRALLNKIADIRRTVREVTS